MRKYYRGDATPPPSPHDVAHALQAEAAATTMQKIVRPPSETDLVALGSQPGSQPGSPEDLVSKDAVFGLVICKGRICCACSDGGRWIGGCAGGHGGG